MKSMSLTENDKRWIAEQLERVQTTLLTEFHTWASPLEMRVHSHSATARAQVEALSARVNKLEEHPTREHPASSRI